MRTHEYGYHQNAIEYQDGDAAQSMANEMSRHDRGNHRAWVVARCRECACLHVQWDDGKRIHYLNRGTGARP